MNENTIIGDDVKINGLYVGGKGKLTIGDNVAISKECNIFTSDHNYLNGLPFSKDHIIKDVIIENNVWIGARVTILKGITIGSGSIVGAGAIVTKNIPCNEIWAGNPAKFIKTIKRHI